MASRERPSWQLPTGVARGTWDYVNDKSIATDYDRFHGEHPLMVLDRALVQETLPDTPFRDDGSVRVVIDVGCGPGRNLLPLAEKGFRTIGVDLSFEMLRSFQEKSEQANLSERCAQVRANMVELDGFCDRSADALLCMYSSMGMVRGRENRRRFMRHVSRILRPDGTFIVHVHNRGSWLRDPGGIKKTVVDWVRSWHDKSWELGDRIYPYRGLPSMYLHIYSEKELRADLKTSGLRLVRLLRLNRESHGYLRSGILSHFRAGGFIAVAKPAQ